MFRVIYNIGIRGMVVIMWLLSPFSSKAQKMLSGRRGGGEGGGGMRGGGMRGGGRKGEKEERGEKKGKEGEGTFCVHCASLGEFEQGRVLIEKLREKYPKVQLVLTFFSPSGYEVRKNYEGVDRVCYLPFDRPKDVRRFLEEINPQKFFIVKYEYWYNLLRELNLRGCEIYLVSAIFRPHQQFFKGAIKGGEFYREMLRFFTKIFVQDKESAELLAGIGVDDNVVVAGDTRFDRVAEIAGGAVRIKAVEEFIAQNKEELTVVCGSTWPADDEVILEVIKQHPKWKFIVAPHEISSGYIDQFIAKSQRSGTKYTAEKKEEATTLMVIDTIGILSSVYQYGQIAYIGGGFGVGIHNTLEAATWGLPVVFGPRYEKFKEARELIDRGGAFSVANAKEINEVMSDLAVRYKECGEIAKSYVQQNTGATRTILKNI